MSDQPEPNHAKKPSRGGRAFLILLTSALACGIVSYLVMFESSIGRSFAMGLLDSLAR